jgi:hypothetical protein
MSAANTYADVLYQDTNFDYMVPLVLRTSNSYADVLAADASSVQSCTSSQGSVSKRRGNKRGTLTSVSSTKFKKASTSIYRKNKAMRHMNEDNESCTSSALLADALEDLAIA